MFLNARIPDCRASGQSCTGIIKILLGTVQFQNKWIQSGAVMVQFWTELPDARMSMPAALDFMPTPSYVENKDYLVVFLDSLDTNFYLALIPFSICSIILPLRGSDYKDKKKCGDEGTIGKPCSKTR
jgi:hypothetical protein